MGRTRKNIREFVKQFDQDRLRVVRGRKHIKVFDAETGHYVATIPGTPSDVRSMINTRANMKAYLK